MKNFLLKGYPIHSLLVGVYIVFFVYTQNLALTAFDLTLRSLFLSLIISAIVFLWSFIFLKKKFKAGVFATLFLFGLFSYGFFYNYLEKLYYFGNWPFANIHRYLIVSYLLVFGSLFLYIRNSKRTFQFINYYFNVLIACLFSINLIQVAIYGIKTGGTDTSVSENPFLHSMPAKKGPDISPDSLPDIYYIILDGYANQHVLQKFYEFDNNDFIGFLTTKGFYIADESRSNYPVTVYSLSSSLNLNYIESTIKEHSLRNINTLTYQNYLSYHLKQYGYRVVHMNSGYTVTNKNEFADQVFYLSGPNEFERSIMRLTIFRLDDLTGLLTYMRLTSQFATLKKFIAEPGPKFSFIHIVCPHPPYVFNDDGHLTIHAITDIGWETRTDYRHQLFYLNTVIKGFLNQILATPRGKKAIIVLQSDHGPWMLDESAENVYEARSKILNAYYVPDKMKQYLYNSITPCNSFRLVFNCLFNEQFPLLDDIPANKEELMNSTVFKRHIKHSSFQPGKVGAGEDL